MTSQTPEKYSLFLTQQSKFALLAKPWYADERLAISRLVISDSLKKSFVKMEKFVEFRYRPFLEHYF